MKQVTKFVLLLLVSVGVVMAASPERQEKIKMEREYRTTALAEAAAAAPSSAWTPIFTMSGITIKYIDYRSNGVVWAQGFTATKEYAGYSNNDGASWTWTELPATTNAGYCNISSANDSTAVVGDFDGNLLRTVDKGKTWTKVYTYSNTDTAWFDAVKFINGTTAIAFGDADWYGLHIVKTTDAGATWTRLTNLPDSAKGAGRFFAIATYGQALQNVGNTIWLAYYSASTPRRMAAPVLKSTDLGATWTWRENTTIRGGTNNYYFRSMAFIDANNGWGVGRQLNSAAPTLTFPLFKTTDGGETWSDTLNFETGVGLANNRVYVPYVVPGTNNVWLIGQDGTLHGSWKSTDGGATFTKVLSPAIAGAFRSIGAKDANNILTASASGLFKYKNAVKVTFIANTSGVPDTLKQNSFVQIRGGAAQLTWGMDSPAKMTNMGTASAPSDYWTYTGYFPAGESFAYKFFTNAKSALTAADEHQGWEGDVSQSSNDRQITVGQNDTTLVVQYVNGFAEKPGQFAAPFPTDKNDTVVCYLRVNMKSFESFDPAKHKVGVRGSFAASQWGTSIILKPENPHVNAGSRQYDAANIYSVPIYWKKSLLDSANSEKIMRFKFVIHNLASPNTEDWSQMVDNPDYQIEFTMPKKDTTVYWRWYRGVPYVPPVGKDTVTMSFRVDMSTSIAQKGFKPGDTLLVRYGYSSTASQVYTDTLKKVGLTGNIYQSANRQVIGVAVGKNLLYQYYLSKNGQDFREIFYDFDYTGSNSSEAERRKFNIAAKNVTVTVADTMVSSLNMRRRPLFQNTGKLSQNVLVTFTCDLRPAYYTLVGGDSLFDVQGAFRTIVPADKDSVYNWGVWINGPAVGGWSNANGDWGAGLRANLSKKMYDDGTHGDAVAGDRIYSMQMQFYKDSINNTIGQVFKFGLYGGDNEGGKGGFGNNHVRNIDDSQPTATIAEDFGSINPKYYRWWNYDTHTPTSVQQNGTTVPAVYDLSQNYPNPFNPSTSIKYSIPNDGFVTLKVYNMLGQEVMTLVNEQQKAAHYTVSFNAGSLASGVYFYKLEAGNFSSVKKMMLLK